MSEHARVVPWTGVSEWRYVADRIFSNEQATFHQAMVIAETWCIRGGHPPAIESTVNLSKLKHEYFGGTLDAPSARLALGSCLVRFVNEVVDASQKGTYALPVTHLAERSNIPRLLVDIRHSVTHDELPSLEVLLYGTDMALNWLKQYYWEPQRNYEVAVRDATKKILERFSEGLKDCDPIKKPLEVFAARCVRDVHHVEYSPEIQIPFLQSILESSYPLPTVLPLISALAIKDPSISIILVDIALNSHDFDLSDRFIRILETAAFQIREHSIVSKCAKKCFLEMSHKGEILIGTILKTQRSVLPEELSTSINILLSHPQAEKLSISSDALIEKTEELSQLAFKPKENVTISENWSIPKDWKPCPFGSTATFNPITQFTEFLVE